MKKCLRIFTIVVTAAAIIGLVRNTQSKRVVAAQLVSQAVPSSSSTTAEFTPDGKLKLPIGFCRWVFLGAPLTPKALNGGESNFPEFHHVYVEQKNLDAYLKTGSSPEGSIIVKELTRVLKPTYPGGSRTEPSERGYFNGELNVGNVANIDMTWVQFYPILRDKPKP